MADDPSLKNLLNPFNIRRLRWLDREGRVNSYTVGVLDVEQTVARLTEEGVKRVEVDRLGWSKVYEVVS